MAKIKNATRVDPTEERWQRLLYQRQAIVEIYNHYIKAGQAAADEGTDDIVDRANNAYNRELMFSLSDAERETLVLVDAALERMEKGRYGDCDHCGRSIGDARLDAVPWARYCISCQERAEMGLLEEG